MMKSGRISQLGSLVLVLLSFCSMWRSHSISNLKYPLNKTNKSSQPTCGSNILIFRNKWCVTVVLQYAVTLRSCPGKLCSSNELLVERPS